MRNFSPNQEFWAIGQTLQLDFHFSAKETLYGIISYYSPGKFTNRYIASAKSPTTTPFIQVYDIDGKMQCNQLSIGWKHFWWGSFNNENNFNIYTTAGFGLLFARAENTYSPVDTSLYDTPAAPSPGEGRFKRLTFDLGLGAEYVAGGNVYLYGDLRTWLPTTSFPSAYLHNNEKVPLPLIISLGIRVLFGYDY
jgi:hypothetical protein